MYKPSITVFTSTGYNNPVYILTEQIPAAACTYLLIYLFFPLLQQAASGQPLPSERGHWNQEQEEDGGWGGGRGGRGRGRGSSRGSSRGGGGRGGRGGGPDDSDDDFDPPPSMPRPSGPASLFDFFDSKMMQKKGKRECFCICVGVFIFICVCVFICE